MAKTDVKQDDREQAARFIADAKALGVDESGRIFNKALKVVVPKHPKTSSKKQST